MAQARAASAARSATRTLEPPMSLSTRPAVLAALALFPTVGVGCVGLDGAGDVSGAYTVTYAEQWNILEEGELVGQIVPGDGASVELSEGGFVFDALCEVEEGEGVCPEDALWGTVQITQLWKTEDAVIQIINRDRHVGQLGDVLGGLVAEDGSFAAYAGSDPTCEGLAVGTVTGVFVEDGIEEGVVSWSLGAGCALPGLTTDGELRLEAEFTAERGGRVIPAL